VNHWCSDLRGGLLGGAALVLARYESVALIEGNESLELKTRKSLSITNLEGFDRLLSGIRARVHVSRYLIDELQSRRDHERQLPNVTFLSGLAALVQRLHAHRRDALTALITDNVARGLGNIAFQVAPLLYERDLCFAELSLAVGGLANARPTVRR